MSYKDDLLRKLSLTQLKQLAEQNRVSLVRINSYIFGGDKYTLTKKSDIIEALIESSKITEKKIREFTEPKKMDVSDDTTEIVRKRIPKAVRDTVWKKYIGVKKAEGKCYVCKQTIHITNFDVGHNKARAKKGSNEIDNLRPICRSCNTSMQTMSIEDFKKKYFSKKR